MLQCLCCVAPQLFYMTASQYEECKPWEVFGTSRNSFEYVLEQSTTGERERLRREYDAAMLGCAPVIVFEAS